MSDQMEPREIHPYQTNWVSDGVDKDFRPDVVRVKEAVEAVEKEIEAPAPKDSSAVESADSPAPPAPQVPASPATPAPPGLPLPTTVRPQGADSESGKPSVESEASTSKSKTTTPSPAPSTPSSSSTTSSGSVTPPALAKPPTSA